MSDVFTTINNNINIGTGSLTCGNVNLGNGGSKIYDDGSLVMSSNDNVHIISSTNGSGYVYIDSGNYNTRGPLYCGRLNASGLGYFYDGIKVTTTGFGAGGVTNTDYMYLNKNSIISYASGLVLTTTYYALHVTGRIGCTDEINIFSDKRIKTNIQTIKNESLETIRRINPVKFNYIDFFKNTQNKDTIGFIAQDVLDVLPEAVSKTVDIIPNIYDVGTLIRPNIITLKTKKTSEFSFDSSPSKNIKIKVFVNNKEEFVYLEEIIDESTFRLTEPITTEITDNSENQIFVYGQEVNDLLTIEKNAIFTMAVGAIKELDAELKEVRIELKDTRATVKKLQEQVEFLMSKIQ